MSFFFAFQELTRAAECCKNCNKYEVTIFYPDQQLRAKVVLLHSFPFMLNILDGRQCVFSKNQAKTIAACFTPSSIHHFARVTNK